MAAKTKDDAGETAAPAPTGAVVACPNCGTRNAATAKFCSNCGTSLVAPTAVTCPQCGTQSAPGTKFCPNCGTSLQAPPPSAQRS